jgi:predicted signal transduction protein with EAL and GGDEF domain
MLLEAEPTRQLATAKAQDVIARLGQAIPFGAESLYIGASIGAAFSPGDADTAEQLVQMADLALYAAKRGGRGALSFYQPFMSAGADARRAAIAAIHAAIGEARVVPHYLPMVSLADQRLCGLEALFQIAMADGKLVSAGELAAAFDDPGTMRAIGDCMLGLATRDMATWRAEGVAFGCVSLNLTAADFAGGTVRARILDRLAELALPPSCFGIEITEAVILSDGQAARTALDGLAAAGVNIALDDFGTGYASLAHLHDYPIERIKVDRSFVSGLGQKAESPVVVKSIVDLGHSLGLKVMAEGIETRDQLDFLKAVGCELGQGYLFARPMQANAVADYLRRAQPGMRKAAG